MQLKKGENGAKDREVMHKQLFEYSKVHCALTCIICAKTNKQVLYVMTDGKIGAPLYDEQVSEEGMTLLDGSIPER